MLAKILRRFRVESTQAHVPCRSQIVLNPVGGVTLRLFHRPLRAR